MSLLFRMLVIIIESFFRKKMHVLSESILTLRVWPNDLDLNMHMNNGRFLTIMDLGRTDLILRADVVPTLFEHKWKPLVGGAKIQYKLSLLPFSKYTLHSKVVAWDEKWFYIEQRFMRKNRTVATGFVKVLFRGPHGNVHPLTVFEKLKMNIDAPLMPARVQKWIESEL